MDDTQDDGPLAERHPALRHAVVASAIGPLRVVVDDAGALAGLYLPDHRPAPPPAALGEEAPADDAAVARVASALRSYLSGAADGPDVPLADVPGTPFQRAVWAAVAAVPFGTTTTYAEIAAVVGRPAAHRAVGAAIGRNPRCLVVPCHRVVGRGGAVVGYAGGVPLKRWLLALEARHAAGGPEGEVIGGALVGVVGADRTVPEVLPFTPEGHPGPEGPSPGGPESGAPRPGGLVR